MRLQNHSGFRRDDLLTFLRAGLKHMGIPLRGLVVVVYDRNGKRLRSRAMLGSRARPARWMQLVIPPEPLALGDELYRRIARVLEHEAMHLLGVQHRDMTEEQLYALGELPAWACPLQLRRVPLPTPEEQQERRQVAAEQRLQRRIRAVEDGLKKWERRLRTAEKRVRELRKKARYYAKRSTS